MQPSSPQNSPDKPGNHADLKPLIRFFAIWLALIAGIYIWFGQLYEAPIDQAYREYLDLLEQASPAAKNYEANYLRHTGRSSVASQDFLMVCSGMVKAAKSENVDPNMFSQNLTVLCEDSVLYINNDFFATK